MSKEGSKYRKRGRSSAPNIDEQLQTIISRLTALEDTSRRPLSEANACVGSPTRSHTPPPPPPLLDLSNESTTLVAARGDARGEERVGACADAPVPSVASGMASVAASLPSSAPASSAETIMSEVADKLVTAINAINPVRSNHNIYISCFDPSFNDFIVWCDEVDHLRNIHGWDDRECLARIGNCLRGDARVWLNEWTTKDRSWSNFKRDFQALCPRRVDIANILFDVMQTNSDRYTTYAEYARRSLLRLRIVSGLSEELISAIIIRGITDPQIRAAATNANLLPGDLVGFSSIYIKPTRNVPPVRTRPRDAPNNDFYDNNLSNREYPGTKPTCFRCNSFGHKQYHCPKRVKSNDSCDKNVALTSNSPVSNTALHKSDPCSFCKKTGHRIEDCFAKQRSESRGKSNANFCRETSN
ncbi:uncharacterized protein LOC114363927 isoform X1 [Ostrinia furnacalis]|uniref:uncharacterized protein LOC114363927 isoform X1 n=1 Tax=Ostrinia furnacalis TaxID=93504 RepID=UPI00103CDB88|nr:uncharacterized protein LOC114363927 isoform X1 [Ostrinia furnacalis]